jgi:hypothetical protein
MENSTIQNLYDLAMPVLEKIGGFLSQSASAAYEIILRQQYVILVQSTLFSIFFGLCSLLIYKLYRKCTQAMEDYNDLDDIKKGAMVILIVLMMGISFGYAIDTIDRVGVLVNPHYYAIEHLVEMFTPGSETSE